MSKYSRWEIWEADVPYIDDPSQSSRRPVLIISPDVALVLKITTHGHSDKPKPYEYEIAKWAESGLTAQSYIQCNRFIKLDEKQFTKKQYGKLKMTDIILLQQMMRFNGLILPEE